MENDGSFGAWVRRRRKALDLTQDELALRVGCALDTIRKLELLEADGELVKVQGNHAIYYVHLAETAATELEGRQQGIWYAQLEIEHGNMRAALKWALTRDALDVALRLGGALGRFWDIHSYLSEGRHWLAETLRRTQPSPTAPRAKALFWAGVLAAAQDEFGQAASLVEDSLAIYQHLEDRHGIANALNRLGLVAIDRGDTTTARALLEESLALRQELGDEIGIAWLLRGLAYVSLHWENDTATAKALAEESLSRFRRTGNVFGTADALTLLGDLYLYWQQNPLVARSFFEESLTIKQDLGDTWGVAESLSDLGFVELAEGDYVQAARLLTESLVHKRELGNTWGMTVCIEGFAQLSAARGQLEQAARLFGAVSSLRNTLEVRLGSAFLVIQERHSAALRAQLDEATFARAWAAGQALSLEQAIAEALAAP
jgi:tetratricopeptide (TPR) repeat protein